MNTRLTYLYRDASNFKRHGEIVLKGRFNQEHYNRIKRTLLDEENFVAESVGIPSVAHWVDEFPANEDDHPFHEFGNLMNSASEPTHSDTIEEMVKKFEWASAEGWKHEDVNPHPLLDEYRKHCKLEWLSWREFLKLWSKAPTPEA